MYYMDWLTAFRPFHPSKPADNKEIKTFSDGQILDKEILLGKIDCLKREIIENESQIAALKRDKENVTQAWKDDASRNEQQIFKLKEDLSRVEAEKQDALTRLSDQLAALTTDLENERHDRVNDSRRFEEYIFTLNEDLSRVEAEKQDALKRLRVNIADLSDQFRPTKLAEMFSELYDNEWTDAFTAISKGLSERQTITFLLDIIMEAYSFCTKEMDTTRRLMSEWYLKESRQVAVMKMTDEKSKRYQTYLQSICGVSTLLDMMSTEVVGKYVMQCVKLCVLMCQHDPPVEIKCQDAIEDACCDSKQSDGANAPMGTASNEKITRLRSEVQHNFNRDKFKEYTSVGPYLEYVVWPVMFLHEGGPMLGKGVAQGTSDSVGRRDDEQWTWKNAK